MPDLKTTQGDSIEELEKRVRLAELLALEAEAEVRLMEAHAKKSAFNRDKKKLLKKARSMNRKKRSKARSQGNGGKHGMSESD